MQHQVKEGKVAATEAPMLSALTQVPLTILVASWGLIKL